MDSIYRSQRHIYDLTRKYYLFGRDRMIDELALTNGGAVLELACGTGRNLDRIGKRWPGTCLYGLDISAEMLKSARARLGPDVQLAAGDATAFDPAALFGQEKFDRVILSFATSMIPQWRKAVEMAASCLAENGSLHIVDFGDMAGLPGVVRSGLNSWLRKFHVTPRHDLADRAMSVARRRRLSCRTRRGMGGYYQLVTLHPRKGAAR
jgi:S-adenosylmethionine-diacylgycerolhomoserine-N-methlytransferase